MRGIMDQASTKRIVLGITGGIAAYKAAELARLLMKQNIDVQVAMTEAAGHFITPTTMQALTGHPVLLDQWQDDNGMTHIHASRSADAIVIAPASADFIAKLAHGLANDLLSTLCLARNCALLIAPAMNREMWQNPATQRNIAQLAADGVQVDPAEAAAGLDAQIEHGACGRRINADDTAAVGRGLLEKTHRVAQRAFGAAGQQVEGLFERDDRKIQLAAAEAAAHVAVR